MKIIQTTDKEIISQTLERPVIEAADLSQLVKEVFDNIKQNGDKALLEYSQKFDKVNLDSIELSQSKWETLANQVSDELKNAILLAKNNIEKFHKAQVSGKIEVQTAPGVHCWQEAKPIEKIGIYIPGGTAPLFSTVLMLAVPAKIAGCKEVILCTPPNQKGEIHPAIAFAAQIAGVTKIINVGGIQAIGALTYGTVSVPKVYKIFGPGNQYVTAAKQYAQTQNCAIDMPAGPSELMVVADETCVPEFVAADLLSQAEHGIDSQVICVVNNEEVALNIQKEVEKQLEMLPRKAIASKALESSKILVISSLQQTIDIINEYAPEHLIICHKEELEITDNVNNAGSVFLGNYTPESAGDYASGTNHTLPTNGYAKQYSGVNMDAFVKKITYQRVTKEGIQNIGKAIELMAEAEELMAHKNAVTLRLK